MYKNNWLAVFIVYLCVTIHVYPFFFPRIAHRTSIVKKWVGYEDRNYVWPL